LYVIHNHEGGKDILVEMVKGPSENKNEPSLTEVLMQLEKMNTSNDQV